MKGYSNVQNYTNSTDSKAAEFLNTSANNSQWHDLCTDSVGRMIEFWGFKRNHGKVWAHLYLYNSSLSALELQQQLRLSKGAVSMITRELEFWKVLVRVRDPKDQVWRFKASSNLTEMIFHVFKNRELPLMADVKQQLEEAEQLAIMADVPLGIINRIKTLRRLAETAEKSVKAFMKTSQWDLSKTFKILRTSASKAIANVNSTSNRDS